MEIEKERVVEKEGQVGEGEGTAMPNLPNN